ncbi:TolC family protein [Methylophilaceae bacterium]|nr:TolC family protein [Methylophilaceae bacterium]
MIAVVLTSALLVTITSLSYLISKNHEAISSFFGNHKKNEIALLEEKIENLQSNENKKAEHVFRLLEENTKELALLNKKYAEDQARNDKKFKEIDKLKRKKIAGKKTVIAPQKVVTDEAEEIILSDLSDDKSSLPDQNEDLNFTVNAESIEKEFLKFTSFVEKDIESGQSLGDLVSVINDASQFNPEVIKKGYDVESLRSSIAVAESANYPTVDFSGRAGQEINWKEAQSQDTNKSYRRDEFSIIGKQNLFDGGLADAEINRTKAGFQSGVYQLKQIKQDIALRAAFVYLDLIRFREVLDQAGLFVKSTFQSASIAKLRYDRRVSDASEFQQINGRLENSKANFISAFNNYEDSRSRFKAAVGYLPSFDFSTKEINLDLIAQAMIPESINNMVDVAIVKHPTMLSATQDIAEAKYQYERTAAESSPIVDLELTGTRTDNEYYGGSGTSDRRYGNAMLTLKYNIFDGGRVKSKKSEMFQLVKSSEALYEQKKREVEDSSRLAWRSYVSLLRQLIPLQKELESAKITDAVYVKQFSVGRTELIDVADKKEILFETAIINISTKYDFLYSGFRVLHACGDILEIADSQKPKEEICK